MSTLRVNTIGNLSSTGTANQVFYRNGSNVVSGSSNLTFDGTTLTAPTFNGNATTATTASACSGVVYNQAINTSTTNPTINLTLPSGTWVVELFFTAHFPSYVEQNMYIDGVLVYTNPSGGDPSGTSYIPMLGIATVSGGRTITCNVTGGGYYGGSDRIVVKAIRTA